MEYNFASECDKVIKAASKLAAHTEEGLLGTEFFVAAMLGVDCEARSFLFDEGLTEESVSDLVTLGRETSLSRVALSERTRKVLDWCMAMASRNGGAITSPLLLLGILNMRDSYAVQKLMALGVDADGLREKVRAYLSSGKDEEEEDEGEEIDPFEEMRRRFMQMAAGMDPARAGMRSARRAGSDREGAAQNKERGGVTREMEKLGSDITQKAREGKLDPVIGRSK